MQCLCMHLKGLQALQVSKQLFITPILTKGKKDLVNTCILLASFYQCPPLLKCVVYTTTGSDWLVQRV